MLVGLLALSLAGFGALAGCGGEGLGECPTDSAAQQATGKTVLTNSCASCHNPNYAGGMPAGGYDFTSDTEVKAEAAEMYGEAEEGAMPPTGKLSATDLEALRVYLACTQ
ncbi:c-type cytochrome [Polyangium sp. y55x31]|uniref:c-type cytochrome n=1 Tax=Polyangium sp. y55x31 TaxID=3042688 RepID=UPI0024829550|nr:c-type cytochrome [Polyangium sp. y55x31]MDI1479558.1 c-type cytochrome [Polyangium sp. y55x31]